MPESPLPYARHTLGNGYRGQTAANIERTASNSRHTFWNGYRGQATAALERILAYDRYSVCLVIVCDDIRDRNITSIIVPYYLHSVF